MWVTLSPASGFEPVPTRSEVSWALFADFCAAEGLRALPASAGTVERFLTACRCSPATGTRRVRSISEAHLALGLACPVPAPPGPRWDRDLVARALGGIVVGGWPAGIRGRRDGALVSLVCVSGLSRDPARLLGAGGARIDAEVGAERRLVARGASGEETVAHLETADEPGACPACAICRWLRCHRMAALSGWRALRDELADLGEDTAAGAHRHECAEAPPALPEHYRSPLFSAIDRHGWAELRRPLSRRSVTSIVARRLLAAAPPLSPGPSAPPVPGDSPARGSTSGIAARSEAAQRLVALEALLDEADACAEAAMERARRGSVPGPAGPC